MRGKGDPSTNLTIAADLQRETTDRQSAPVCEIISPTQAESQPHARERFGSVGNSCEDGTSDTTRHFAAESGVQVKRDNNHHSVDGSNLMILDIPTKTDFEEQGLTLLNLAWDTVTDLLLQYDDAEDWNAIVEEEQTEHYAKASQKPLAIATALLQQGAEFLVKAAIAEISPFLLISGSPQAWPKRCESTDTPFSAFKTPDAEDLIRIHNTVSPRRFSESFMQRFCEMRRIRNTIFHTVDRDLRFSEKEILSAVLTVTAELLGPLRWIENRHRYLESIPSAAFATEVHGFTLVREFALVLELFGNAELRMHFGFNKKQRRYLCPECRSACSDVHSELTPMTAQLKPNSPTSRTLYCVVCRTTTPVARRPCPRDGCNGNVINQGEYSDEECLTCGECE